MASDKIKGVTAKIGADTSDFIKELKKLDKSINYTQKQANELQKGLDLDFDASRFEEKQKLVRQALEDTEEKAKAIREQLAYLEETGAVNTEGYQRLKLELAKTENQAILLNKQLDATNNKKTTNVVAQIKNLANNLSVSATAGIAVATAIGKSVKETTKYADEIATVAVKYGQSTTAIQKWNYVAMQSDVASNTLYRSIKKLNSAFAEQAQGEINNSTKALEQLGINIANFPDTETAFEATISAISRLNDVTSQTYYANQIFGEQMGAELIPLFQQGSEAINSYIKEFEQSGALTEDQIQDLAEFDNLMNRISTQFKNIAYQLGSALMPIIRRITQFIEETVVPLLKFVMELLTPIIDALSWIGDKFLNIGATILGKGWLWGKDSQKTQAMNSVSNINNYDYTIPATSQVSSIYNEDNSTNNIDITLNATGELSYDSKALADEVIKQIQVKKQASGR